MTQPGGCQTPRELSTWPPDRLVAGVEVFSPYLYAMSSCLSQMLRARGRDVPAQVIYR
jgi:hypothetical protein